MAERIFISLGPDRAEFFRWAPGSSGNEAGDRLVQATAEREGEGSLVGAVYLGRVVRLERHLNAAFVELGLDKPGLLPLKKHDKISEGDAIAVVVKREAREDKGVRLGRAFPSTRDPAAGSQRTPPALLLAAPTLWQNALKVLAPDRVAAIHCDRRADAERVSAWCRETAPGLTDKVRHQPRRDWELNDAAAKEEIAAALQEEVHLPSGGHLLFEPVRTLTAVDVNSSDAGARRGDDRGGIAETALAVNLAAAQEIPVQLALRNLGGIIVIDFIDIENRGKREQVIETLREAVIVDPAIDWVGNMSRLGLVELRRRRAGPGIAAMWGTAVGGIA
ncbi:MAG: ribonuclease E/G [Dongia sp.]